MQTVSNTNINTKKKHTTQDKSYNHGLNQQLIYLIY